jgi:hypothetical protein
MSAKDHPNNAPGMPMLFRPCLDRLQMIPRTAAEICALGSTAPVRTGRLYKLTG